MSNSKRVSTEFTDAKGVTREIRGVVKPLTAARNGWTKLFLVFRDAEGRIIDKTQLA